MSAPRTTAKDIARHLHVSPMTVSYALRGHHGVSEKTRQKVLMAAKSLGYRPNLAARALRGASTQTIGLLTGALNVESNSQKVQGFETAAREAGYVTIMAFSPNDDPGVEDKLIRSFVDRRVDGIVVYPTESGEHRELRRLVASRFPVVTIDGAGRVNFECDDVSTDYYRAGRMQVEHLLSRGLRRLCQVNSLPSCFTKDQIRRGVLDAAQEAGVPRPALWDIDIPAGAGSNISDDMVRQIGERLDREVAAIDGLVSYDLMAAAALRAAFERGIRVPQDLAIMGFDDSPIARNSVISLSSVAHPTEQVGRQAFDLLRRRIESPVTDSGPQRHLVNPVIRVRATAP